MRDCVLGHVFMVLGRPDTPPAPGRWCRCCTRHVLSACATSSTSLRREAPRLPVGWSEGSGAQTTAWQNAEEAQRRPSYADESMSICARLCWARSRPAWPRSSAEWRRRARNSAASPWKRVSRASMQRAKSSKASPRRDIPSQCGDLRRCFHEPHVNHRRISSWLPRAGTWPGPDACKPCNA